MDKTELEHFKSALRDVPYCNLKIIRLNEKIEQMEEELTGLARHSIPMTREQANSPLPMPKYSAGMSLTERIYEIDQVKAEADYYRKRILDCRAIEWLALEQQNLIFDLFFFKKNQWDKAEELGITRRSLGRRVDSMLCAIL